MSVALKKLRDWLAKPVLTKTARETLELVEGELARALFEADTLREDLARLNNWRVQLEDSLRSVRGDRDDAREALERAQECIRVAELVAVMEACRWQVWMDWEEDGQGGWASVWVVVDGFGRRGEPKRVGVGATVVDALACAVAMRREALANGGDEDGI